MLSSFIVVLSLGMASADTGDTGIHDTGSPENGTEDTAAAAEPSAEETGGSAFDTGTINSASQMAGEKGGFGCSTVGMGGAVAFWVSTLVLGLRREE